MTAPTVSFVVPGEPLGKMRPRFRRAGAHVRTYTPAKTRDYEASIAAAADVAATNQGYEHPERGWYEMEVLVYRTHERKGSDITNVVKSVEDACNGVLWRDDSELRQVTQRLAGWGEAPRVEVTVRAYPYVDAATRRRQGRFMVGDRVKVGKRGMGTVTGSPDDPRGCSMGTDSICVLDDDDRAEIIWDRESLIKAQGVKRARAKGKVAA